MTIWHGALVFGAAFLAGMINSVAGGGTLVSFPALIWAGLPPVVANATSAVAIWPGALGGMWGFRRELRGSETRFFSLVIPSLIGGAIGAALLRHTPPGVFAKLVPFLILAATILFMAQETIRRWLRKDESAKQPVKADWTLAAMAFQLAVAIYGGYFGAGIGILMLAALGLMGLTDIHQMNGLKNFFTLCINGVASAYFIFAGMVHWPDAIVMAAGAVIGGYGSAGLARRLGPRAVRRFVIAVGLAMAISLFLKNSP